MSEQSVELVMPASPEAVWAVVGDFGGLGDWFPGIESSRVEGDDRILGLMGMEIRERLIEKDDASRRLVYSIVDGAPVETHRATITVFPEGDGSKVTWVVEATPDSMVPLLADVYSQSLAAVKERTS